MAGWRFYARRPEGTWIDTDVQLAADDITDQVNGPGVLSGTIPRGLFVPYAADGLPMWLERGTKLYAELDHALIGVYVCTQVDEADDGGVSLEFTSLDGAYDWILYESDYAAWAPTTLQVVTELVTYAQTRTNAIGFTIAVKGDAPPVVGDAKPPARPVKPGKAKGETASHYKARVTAWQAADTAWVASYGDKEKFALHWYESPYVGAELQQLATETGFTYRTRHRWVDRDARIAEHVLELSAAGIRRTDVRFTDGVNIAQRLNPTTSLDDYANDVVALGSGEGSKMKRGRSTAHDPGRFPVSKVVSKKTLKSVARLRAFAEKERKAAMPSTALDSATVWDNPGFASISTLRPGDEVWVESTRSLPVFGAYQRITSVKRTTANPRLVELRFAAQAEPTGDQG